MVICNHSQMRPPSGPLFAARRTARHHLPLPLPPCFALPFRQPARLACICNTSLKRQINKIAPRPSSFLPRGIFDDFLFFSLCFSAHSAQRCCYTTALSFTFSRMPYSLLYTGSLLRYDLLASRPLFRLPLALRAFLSCNNASRTCLPGSSVAICSQFSLLPAL